METDIYKNQNLASTNESLRWIENLALDELNMEESGIVHFDDHLNIDQLLNESSLEIMNRIRDLVEIYVTKFNEYRTSENPNTQGAKIKIFKISNTVNDFMLFRNSLKLVFARKSNDIISVGFLSRSGGLYSARINQHTPAINTAHEIAAHVGPFNKITWNFQGEVVDLEIMVKHYLSEFIKHSAR